VHQFYKPPTYSTKIDIEYVLYINYINKIMARDYCSGLRKIYNGILSVLASTNVVACIVTATPILYMIILAIYQSRMIVGYNTSSIWAFFATLLVGWILGIIAIWKTMPNLLSFTIFLYKAIGYWCLITTFIVLFYMAGYLPLNVLGYLLAAIIPSIFLLLASADVLRIVRTRLYTALEALPTLAPVTAVPAVDTRPVT
jgi:hypothetical protein